MRFSGKSRFYGFGRKTRFCNFGGKRGKRVSRFWREKVFCGFDGKTCFAVFAEKRVLMWKCIFIVLTGKSALAKSAFLRENYDFGQNCVLWFWRENAFCSFGGKMRFCGFVIFHEWQNDIRFKFIIC